MMDSLQIVISFLSFILAEHLQAQDTITWKNKAVVFQSLKTLFHAQTQLLTSKALIWIKMHLTLMGFTLSVCYWKRFPILQI